MKKQNLKLITVISYVLLFAFCFLPLTALAVDPVSGGEVGGQIPTGSNPDAPFSDQLTIVLNVLLALASTVAVGMLIIGGYTYMTSAGNEENSKKAKTMITGAIIGLVIIILSFAAVNYINQLIG